jgi:hypothetical protein
VGSWTTWWLIPSGCTFPRTRRCCTSLWELQTRTTTKGCSALSSPPPRLPLPPCAGWCKTSSAPAQQIGAPPSGGTAAAPSCSPGRVDRHRPRFRRRSAPRGGQVSDPHCGGPFQQILSFYPAGSPLQCRFCGTDVLQRDCSPPWDSSIHGVGQGPRVHLDVLARVDEAIRGPNYI